MKTLIGTLLALFLIQPTVVLADRGFGGGVYPASGAVVVGGRYGGPRGYYGPRWGYRGPSVGVYFGGPVPWGWPWGPPLYYPQPVYPPLVAVPPPVVYIEKGDGGDETSVDDSAAALAPGYWYYCRESAAYYPAVMQCPGPWVQVAPRPE